MHELSTMLFDIDDLPIPGSRARSEWTEGKLSRFQPRLSTQTRDFCERVRRGYPCNCLDLSVLSACNDVDLEYATQLLLKSKVLASTNSLIIPLHIFGPSSITVMDNLTALLRHRAMSLKHVSFRRNEDTNILYPLLDAIAHNTSVEKLTFEFIQDSTTSVRDFDSLLRATNLTTMECLECHDQVSSALLDTLVENTTIKHLRIQKHWEPLGETTIQGLTSLVACSATLEKLEIVANIQGHHLDFLVASLALNRKQTLKSLEISVDNMMLPPPKPLEPADRAFDSVRLPLMVEHASNLTDVSFSGHKWIRSDLLYLSQVMISRRCEGRHALQNLTIQASDCHASDPVPLAFWHSCLGLQSVHLEWLDFGHIEPQDLLANVDAFTLQALELSCCKFTAAQALALLDFVAARRAPSLQVLRLDVTDSVSDDMLHAMAQCHAQGSLLHLHVNFLDHDDLEKCTVSITISTREATGNMVLGNATCLQDLECLTDWVGQGHPRLLCWRLELNSLPRPRFVHVNTRLLTRVAKLGALQVQWLVDDYSEQDGTDFVHAVLQSETVLSIVLNDDDGTAPSTVQEGCRFVLDRNRVLDLLRQPNAPKALWTNVFARFNRHEEGDVSALYAALRFRSDQIAD